jgi:hypothetical protein
VKDLPNFIRFVFGSFADDKKEDLLDELLKDLETESPKLKGETARKLHLVSETPTEISARTGKCFPVYLGGTNSERVRRP